MDTTEGDLDIETSTSPHAPVPAPHSTPKTPKPLPSPKPQNPTPIPTSKPQATRKNIPSLLDVPIKRTRKRHASFGSKEEEDIPSIWRPQAKFSPFLVVEQLLGVQINKEAPCSSLGGLSLFKIANELKKLKICNIVDAQKHGNTLLIKVGTASDSDRLLQCVEFCGLPVKVKPHSTLNSSKGVVQHGWFRDATPGEMEQISGVTEADEIVIKKDGKPCRTGLWVLTFDTPVCPQHIDVHWIKRIPVRPYIPKPMRCFKCQKFGHKGQKCRSRTEICVRCGAKEKHTNCDKQPKCSNCKGNHEASDRSCTEYEKNQNILKHRANYGGTFAQARETLYPKGQSYSGAVKGALSDAKQQSNTSLSQNKQKTPSASIKSSHENKKQNKFVPPQNTFSFPNGTSPSSFSPTPAPQKPEMESETAPSIPKGSTLTSTSSPNAPVPDPPPTPKTKPIPPPKPSNPAPKPTSKPQNPQSSVKKPITSDNKPKTGQKSYNTPKKP